MQTIVPWATNLYTETLIAEVRAEFGERFWGFWMLGGMSGGGMGFIFEPRSKAEAQERLQAIMSAARRRFEHALPFAMEPVVYDFAINERGTWCDRLTADSAPLPPGYYALNLPDLMRRDPRSLPASRRAELDAFGAACRTRPELSGMVQTLFDRLLPQTRRESAGRADADGAAGGARLRPGRARADPQRPEAWAHRAGAEPSAGQHGDPGCGARRCVRRRAAA